MNTPEKHIETCDLLARVDERTKAIQTDVSLVRESVKDISHGTESKFRELEDKIEEEFVKIVEFDPIKKLVYGFVGFILLAIGGMFITLLTKSQHVETPPTISAPQVPGAK